MIELKSDEAVAAAEKSLQGSRTVDRHEHSDVPIDILNFQKSSAKPSITEMN